MLPTVGFKIGQEERDLKDTENTLPSNCDRLLQVPLSGDPRRVDGSTGEVYGLRTTREI
jgi:hypothetical protein